MAEPAAPARPPFDPVDTSFDPNEVSARDDVESPSLSSGNALARFEFEPGRSKDGTKVLMVEWEDDKTTAAIVGDWEVSWEGKNTVLPARDHAANADAGSSPETPINRLYFLIQPGIAVPGTVQLRKGTVIWKTNPLPAIFSPELGATARQAGRKGVLHTIWAKKRLEVLQREIETEEKDNVEGLGLEMAIAEKEWIEHNFGIVARPSPSTISPSGAVSPPNFSGTPSSPRSPGGGRLMDKLRGLRLGTTPQDLASRPDGASGAHNPLSPETDDVAVGGFGNFAALKGASTASSATPSTASSAAARAAAPAPRKITAQLPPDSLAAQQHQHGGMASLNAFANGDTGFSSSVDAADGGKDDLFALPMSPRSPEMTKSPFSFGTQDTMRYLREERT